MSSTGSNQPLILKLKLCIIYIPTGRATIYRCVRIYKKKVIAQRSLSISYRHNPYTNTIANITLQNKTLQVTLHTTARTMCTQNALLYYYAKPLAMMGRICAFGPRRQYNYIVRIRERDREKEREREFQHTNNLRRTHNNN